MGLVIKILVNGFALWLAAYLIPGITLGDGSDTGRKLVSILVVALIFGVVNAIVKPIVKLLSLPVIVLTLGLFLLVVNALMLELTSWIAGGLNIDFHVDSFFWDAILGALVITVVASILNAVIPDRERVRG